MSKYLARSKVTEITEFSDFLTDFSDLLTPGPPDPLSMPRVFYLLLLLLLTFLYLRDFLIGYPCLSFWWLLFILFYFFHLRDLLIRYPRLEKKACFLGWANCQPKPMLVPRNFFPPFFFNNFLGWAICQVKPMVVPSKYKHISKRGRTH